MENKICQSCSIPITSNEQLGTNKDGSINMDYCKYCYESGEFVNKVTMEEYIDICSKYSSQTGVTYEEMKEHCSTIFPTLKDGNVLVLMNVLGAIILIVHVKILSVIVLKNNLIKNRK